MLTVGSLCTGYGGLELAATAVFGPLDLRWVADNDPGAKTLLAHRHPDVANLDDITKTDWPEVEPVDVLLAGFPCQDISDAGRRAGIEGARSGVWTHVADAVRVLRPRLVVLENVRALLGRGLGRVVGDLAEIGYDASWVCVRASDIGAAHKRDRIFIVAVPADTESVGHGHPWATGEFGLASAAVGGPVRPGPVALLPTPVAHDDGKSVGAHLAIKAAMPGGERTQITSLAVLARAGFRQPLLPTPNAALGRGTGFPSQQTAADRFAQGKRFLDDAVALLPTPAARDAHRGFGWGDQPGRPLSETIARLLPTPRTTDIFGAGEHGDGGMDLRTAVTLLPTPRATDGTKGGPNMRGSSGDLMLPSAVMLLPTPRATRGGSHTETRDALLPTPMAADGGWGRGSTTGNGLRSTVRDFERWGDYAPAVERWEHLTGRPAPDPTEPGRTGNPRLSARFVEWLMGLPDGWVTDPAIWQHDPEASGKRRARFNPATARNRQLRLLGNGVVPAQGAYGIASAIEAITGDPIEVAS